jgi:YrbI family 3-deoxy-D-manno-octulosonate 8-phosphate phosphatase
MNFKERLQKVKCFVFDIDGVLTDGQLHILQDGTMLRNMNIKDGYALRQAFLKNYPIFVISGSNAEGVKQRLKNLGIEEVYLNCKDKLDQLSLLLVKHHRTISVRMVPNLRQRSNSLGVVPRPGCALFKVQTILRYCFLVE